MLISQVTIAELKQYANVYHNLDDSLFSAILEGAKQFIATYIGKDVADLDQYSDLVIALYILSNEMYDNRMVHIESNKIGFVIKQLLDSHSTNLL